MSSQLKRMCVHRAGAGTEAQPVDSTGLEEAPKCSGSSEVPGELESQPHGPWPQHCSVSVPLTVQCTKQTPFCVWGPQQAGLRTGHLRGVRRTATKATETSQRGKWQTKNSRIPETIILKTKMNQSEDVEKVGI